MMDLISREDALAVVRYSKNAVDGIENLPSVDAVEVVRCKDCKWYKQNPFISDEEDFWCQHWVDWLPTKPEDYCSYGEKRDAE
jgi:hypothetical protein